MKQTPTSPVTASNVRRTTLASMARAAYDWFANPQSSYEVASRSLTEATSANAAREIAWEKKSETVYEGTQSVQGTAGSGQQVNYRIEIGPDGRLLYQQSRHVYGGGASVNMSVNAGKALRNPNQDLAVQTVTMLLLVGAQQSLAKQAPVQSIT